MEHLTKQQLILAALLVSFVSSIATGIVTVSLLDQTPQGVTQTINQVVERTIEKVVIPPDEKNDQKASVITTKETVVVKAEDQTVAVIEKNEKSVVKIKGVINAEGVPQDRTGILLTTEGLIATDAADISVWGKYEAVTSDGMSRNLKVVNIQGDKGVAFLQIQVPGADVGKVSFSTINIGSQLPKLGQSVISVSAAGMKDVAIGIVSSLVESVPETKKGEAATTTAKYIEAIRTTIDSPSIAPGSPLFNLAGETTGIKVSRLSGAFLPIDIIKKLIPAQTE
jgi:hypothetical protein